MNEKQKRNLFPAVPTSIFFGLLVLTSLYVFVSRNYKASVKNVGGQYTSDSVSDIVELDFDNIGVPHIRARNEQDMIFGLGFVHARDRLWQIDFKKRLIEGRMSEILGSGYLETDKFMRSLEIKELSKELYHKLTDEERYFLNAYASGYNEFIRQNHKDLPVEFGIFGVKPDSFLPSDCIAIQRLFALRQNTALWFEPLLFDVADRITPEKAVELIPKYPRNMPLQFAPNQNIDSEEFIPEDELQDTTDTETENSLTYKTNEHADFSRLISSIANQLLINPLIEGCNFKVSKKDLNDPASGVIVSNDFHSAMSLPTPWYFVRYSCPGINAAGATVPGFPFIIAGRNDLISFGITNMRLDEFDFVLVEIDSTGKYYKAPGDTLKKITLKLDTIKIADSSPDIHYQKFIGDRPLLTGELFDRQSLKTKKSGKSLFTKYAMLAESPLGRESHEFRALYRLTKAENPEDFKNAVSSWKYPGTVFGYGDIFGNFGLKACGETRRKSENGFLPGLLTVLDTLEYVETKYDYEIFNDSNLFLFSANNSPAISDSALPKGYFVNWARAYRIAEMMSGSVTYDITDAKIMQNDIYSSYAKKMLEICIPIWRQHEDLLKPVQKQALNALSDFDYIFSDISIEASIFSSFIERLHYNIFADELGDILFERYMEYPDFADAKVYRLLTEDPTSSWFDNIETDEEVENAYFLIFKSFMEGVNSLMKHFQSADIYDWNYEYFNTYKPAHFLSDNEFLNDTYDVPAMFEGGNRNTVTNFRNNLNVAFGSTMRFIVDCNSSELLHIMPGGQSGNPVSSNFSNQLNFRKSSAYYSIPTGKDKAFDTRERVLISPK